MLRFPGGAFRREDLDQTSSVGTYVTFFKQSRGEGGGGPESRENRGKDKEAKGRKREDTGGLESKNQRQTDRWKKERRRGWERAAERGRQGGNGGRGKGEGEGLSKKMMGEEMREQRKQGAGEGMKPDGNTRAAGRERRGEGAPPFYQPLSPTEGGSGSESQGRHSAPPGAPSPRADTVQRPGLASLPRWAGRAAGYLDREPALGGRAAAGGESRLSQLELLSMARRAAGGAAGAPRRRPGGGRGAECRRDPRSGRRRPGRETGSGHVPPACTARAAGRRTPRAPRARGVEAAPVRGVRAARGPGACGKRAPASNGEREGNSRGSRPWA